MAGSCPFSILFHVERSFLTLRLGEPIFLDRDTEAQRVGAKACRSDPVTPACERPVLATSTASCCLG